MEVILLKELQGRGGEGDIINVARGFANNYLLKQGIAVKATKGNLKQLEQRKANIEKREEERIASANELAARLNDLRVNIKAQVGEEGQLFGSVTSAMIAEALIKEHGVEIEKRRVELGKPIKVTGEYKVPVNIYRSISGTVTVVVSGEQVESAQTDEKPATEAVEEIAVEGEVEATEVATTETEEA